MCKEEVVVGGLGRAEEGKNGAAAHKGTDGRWTCRKRFRKAVVRAGVSLGLYGDAQRTRWAAPAVFTDKCPAHRFFRLLLV